MVNLITLVVYLLTSFISSNMILKYYALALIRLGKRFLELLWNLFFVLATELGRDYKTSLPGIRVQINVWEDLATILDAWGVRFERAKQRLLTWSKERLKGGRLAEFLRPFLPANKLKMIVCFVDDAQQTERENNETINHTGRDRSPIGRGQKVCSTRYISMRIPLSKDFLDPQSFSTWCDSFLTPYPESHKNRLHRNL